MSTLDSKTIIMMKALNETIDETEKRISRFSDTLITLFTSIFSGLFIFGINTKFVGHYETYLFFTALFLSIFVVFISITIKYLEWLRDKTGLDSIYKQKENYLNGDNAVLVSIPNKFVMKILDSLPIFVYILVIINMFVLFLFSIAKIL